MKLNAKVGRLAFGLACLCGLSTILALTCAAGAAQGDTSAAVPVAWPQPPPFLQLPSRTGPEGPPSPRGPQPQPGASAAPTPATWRTAQDRALLFGPFPRAGLPRGISDGQVLAEDPALRAFVVSRSRAAGARVLRIPVSWRNCVARTDGDFEATDPANHAYRFGAVDAAVRAAAAEGLEPLLVVSHAPAFAEAPHRWRFAYPGSWDPSPAALEAFAVALARRYDGSFPDPLERGRFLPPVRLYQAWNEPNLPRYLEPQWVAVGGRWHAFSPTLYRGLLNAFYTGVKASAPSALVVGAGVAPIGDPTGLGRMAPIRFLRDLLCLPVTAGAQRAVGCGPPAHLDALAYHPLSVESPDLAASSSLDVAVSDAGKVTAVLREARRLGTILPAGPKALWITEINWESAPQAAHGVPPARQAQWISRALHRLWIAGAQMVDWQFLLDRPSLRLASATGGHVERQRFAGLYSSSTAGLSAASPKPFLLGFEFPFDPLRVNRREVRVWALPPAPGQRLILQRRRGRIWVNQTSLNGDSAGVVNELVSLKGAGRIRLLDGSRRSATAEIGRSRALSLATG